MKKIFFILLLIIVCLTPSFTETDESEKKDKGIRIDAGLGFSGSIFSSFITLKPEILYDFGLIAAGIGVNTLFGLTFSDIYMAPYAEFEIGWFYLAGGAIFEVKPPEANAEKAPDGFIKADDDSGIYPYVVIGANAAIIKLDPGAIGFDVNLGFIPTATPVQVVENNENFLATIMGSIILSLTSLVFDSVKIGASIYYSIVL